MTRLVFSDEARTDLRAAHAFYSAIAPGLAKRFALAVDEAVRRIVERPLAWPPINKRMRRCLLDRFPHALIYRVDAEPLRVIAVMHHRQRPGYWRGRE